jgi:hypothetical protein
VPNCDQRDAACRATRKVRDVKDVINSVIIAVPQRRDVTWAV